MERVVLEGLMEPMVLDSHVKRALTVLKNKKLAKYKSTSYPSPITFLP